MKMIVNGVEFNNPKEIDIHVEADPEGNHVDHVNIVVTGGELIVDEGVVVTADVANGGRLSICKTNHASSGAVSAATDWGQRMLEADEQQIVDMGR